MGEVMPAAPHPVVVRAHAKLTLTLRVLGIRSDGFHALEALTVMVSAPFDTLRIGPEVPGEVTVRVHGGAEDVPRDETNLVVRAARAVLPSDAGAAIELTKSIPSGAGLGGGSADAAAVLRVLRDRHGIDAGAVMAAAAALGSDVPVCLLGRPVMMRGRGELLDPVELADEIHLVIATPTVHVSTPTVFRAWDAMGGPRSDRVVEAPNGVGHLVDGLVNDLEPAAEAVAPELAEFRERIEAITGMSALLAGSGSSYWLAVSDAETAAYVAARLNQELQIETVAGHALRNPIA